jgi:import inner membrane translocase subunit TIM17
MDSRPSPCPHRCFDDLGSAFAMGAIGGAFWHGAKGIRNSPKGDRLRGGYQQIVMRAPAIGGNFAVWGGLFSFFDCGLIHIRQREDPLNSITAGALTGGLLAARAGARAAATNAVIGGALLALIEGVGFMFGRMSTPTPASPMAPGTTAGAAMMMMGAQENAAPTGLLPRQTLTGALEPISEQQPAFEATLEEDSDWLRSRQDRVSAAAEQAKQTSAFKLRSPLPQVGRTTAPRLPVYTAAQEFSSEDFTFNDQGDFDEEEL